MATTINANNTDGVVITPDTSGELELQANGSTITSITANGMAVDTNTLYVDATNNRVGIGTSIPSNSLHLYGSSSALRVERTGSDSAALITKTTLGHYGVGTGIGTATNCFNVYDYGASAERMRIDSSKIIMGSSGSYNGLEVYNVSGGTNVYRSITGGGIIHFFSDVGGTRALKSYINESGGLTTVSDYRLKENIIPVDNATETIKLLNPVHFNFIGLDKKQSGFIAHELKDVIPHMVDGDKDQLKEDGTPFIQMVDHTKLIPYLTKALQEAITKIEALEARIQALENA